MEKRFAVYLNAKARRVSPDVVARIEELVHPDDIYFSTTPEDALRHAETIVSKGYPTVFTGGGDGTVCRFIDALYHVIERQSGEKSLPVLGVLSLGTGNALSRLVSSGNAIQDLKAYISNPSSDIWPLPLVECEGHLFPFGGAGLDAEVLLDYEALKEMLGEGPLKPVFRNIFGYFLAFFARTAPRKVFERLRRKRRFVKVVAVDEWVTEASGSGRSFGPGHVVYEGEATTVVVGTIPTIGYGAKVLPYAGHSQGLMNLRVAKIGLARALISLPELWHGTYRGADILDFLAKRIEVRFSEPTPFQVGGDVVGLRERLEFRVVPEAIKLLRFI